jgi:outer membrane protein assembly factor BamB
LQWQVQAPAGSSSPIVAAHRVWLTGYSGSRRSVLCLNLETGLVLWERSLESERAERKTEPNDAASSTPVTDGSNVYALFSGIGLVSYTADGQERWRRLLGPFNQPHGMSSSPILVENTIIVLADQVRDRVFVNNGAVPPFETLTKELKADLNGDGKLTPDEFPDPSFKGALLAIDRVYGNGDGAVDIAEWDGALRLMQVLDTTD